MIVGTDRRKRSLQGEQHKPAPPPPPSLAHGLDPPLLLVLYFSLYFSLHTCTVFNDAIQFQLKLPKITHRRPCCIDNAERVVTPKRMTMQTAVWLP